MAVATVDELQKEHEARLAQLLAELAGRGAESNLALARADPQGRSPGGGPEGDRVLRAGDLPRGDDRPRSPAPARRRQEHRRPPRRRSL